jgi:hypothetical protein
VTEGGRVPEGGRETECGTKRWNWLEGLASKGEVEDGCSSRAE